jgi:ABC-type multidrug transport system ATPase subunit
VGAASETWGPDIIRLDPGERVVVGRSPAATAVLGHPSVSRQHAELRLADGRLVVADLGSRFGTFVDGQQVESRTIADGSCVSFGAVPYRYTGGALRLVAVSEGLGIEARDLAVQRGGRRILAGVDVSIRPGQFVGLIGPSGAGKSTLLKCVAGLVPPTAGSLIADGRLRLPAEVEAYHPMVGYVPQDDVVHHLLTAREAFDYAIRLRLGRDTAAERSRRVAALLERLQLEKDAERLAAMLSGGQRKRINVGLELLTQPRGLFLDEPTAGLDPALAARLMRFLKGLAAQGVTVVCVTHLPGDVAVFDQVVVVAAGTVAFAGPPRPLLARFGVSSFPELFEKIDTLPGQAAENLAAAIGRVGAVTGPAPDGLEPGAARVAHPASSTPSIPFFTQVVVLAARGWRVISRDRTLLLLLLGQPVLIGLLISLSQIRPASLAPLFLFAVVAAVWLGLNCAAREVVRDRPQYVRERLAGVTPEGYLAAKALVLGVVGLAQVTLLAAAVRYANLLPPEDARDLAGYSLLYLVAVLLVAYLSGLALGLLVSTLAGTQEAAVAALPLIVLPQLLLTGVATGLDADAGRTGAFRPLVELARRAGEEPRGVAGWVVEIAALPTYSRPAAALLRPSSAGRGLPSHAIVVLVDWLHAMLLLTATAAALVSVFRRRQRIWLERA